MKGNKGLMIIAVASIIAFCFLNELRYALIVLVLAYWFINEKKATSMALQPLLIWLSARVFLAFFSFLMIGISDLIAAFGKFNSIDTKVLKFINPLCSLWIVVFLSLCAFFFIQGQDTPIYGKFANKIADVLHGRRNGFKDEKVVEEETKE